TADADVRVVALREDPAVASRHHAELDPRGSLERRRPERSPRNVPLESDPTDDLVAEPDGLGDDAVRAVGPDDIRDADAPATDDRRPPVVRRLDLLHARSVPEFRAGVDRLASEERIEPTSLRHQDHRLLGPAREPSPVAEPEDHAIDDVLDHRRHVARGMA